MKNKINIFSSNKIINFITTLFSNYELTFLKLEEIDYKQQYTRANIIIINSDKDVDKINYEKLNENFLIISNLISKKLIFNNNPHLLKTPTPINNIKNKIENFLQNIKFHYHDISIENEQLINLTNSHYCYLTKAEMEILTYLIKEREVNKNFIKENILKIKSNVETNSLESHLSRIRKKMNEVGATVKIQTKNEKLIIST